MSEINENDYVQEHIRGMAAATKEAAHNVQLIIANMPRTSEFNNAHHYLTISLMFLERGFNNLDPDLMQKHLERQERRQDKGKGNEQEPNN